MHANYTKLRLVHYVASDGPRVMFSGSLSGDFCSLHELFKSLSISDLEQVEIDSLGFIVASGVRLSAICTKTRYGGESVFLPGIRRVGNSSRPHFTWRLTSDEWRDMAHLIEPLCEAARPGHQYLTIDASEDALVVVSAGEYDDQNFQRELQ